MQQLHNFRVITVLNKAGDLIDLDVAEYLLDFVANIEFILLHYF